MQSTRAFYFVLLVFSCGLVLLLPCTNAQEPNVVLTQGVAVGVKVFPDSSRIPVYAYLGIPYAAPPVGDLRFAPPVRHPGWNRTLFAQEMGPICPQLLDTNHPSTSTVPGSAFVGSGGQQRQDEDCLYLNVWTPETAIRYGNLQVVIYFDGEGFVGGSPVRPPAQDLASEGIVVVSATFRNNIFGFFCLGDSYSRGNLGILDQYFALLWVRDNIVSFGGDPQSITLMGHSAGAASVLYHMTSPRTNGLFNRVILMSGTALSPWLQPTDNNTDPSKPSKELAHRLGCLRESSEITIQCLRERTVDELLRAYDSQFQNGNWSELVLPVVDSFLPEQERYLPIHPMTALENGEFVQVQVLTGITSMEAGNMQEQWNNLARQGYGALMNYIEGTIIPNIIFHYKLDGPNKEQIRELIRWQYLSDVNRNPNELLGRLQTMVSDAQLLSPHLKTLQVLSKSRQPLYVYNFHSVHSLDMYGRIGNYTGAGHGSELPFLFGPTLLQQLARRRLTQTEERLSKRMRVLWSDFIKSGNPTPGRQYESWRRYTQDEKFILGIVAEGIHAAPNEKIDQTAGFWNELLPKISNISFLQQEHKESPGDVMQLGHDSSKALRHGVFSLIGVVVCLLALLAVCLVLLKKAKERDRDRELSF